MTVVLGCEDGGLLGVWKDWLGGGSSRLHARSRASGRCLEESSSGVISSLRPCA